MLCVLLLHHPFACRQTKRLDSVFVPFLLGEKKKLNIKIPVFVNYDFVCSKCLLNEIGFSLIIFSTVSHVTHFISPFCHI